MPDSTAGAAGMTSSSAVTLSPEALPRGRSHRRRSGERYASVWMHLAALLAIVVFLAPFAWLAIASVSTRQELLARPLHWIPQHLDFSRWHDIFTGDATTPAGGFRSAMVNSAIVA